MQETTNHKKTYVVTILCISAIFSAYLIKKSYPETKKNQLNTVDSVTEENLPSDDSWKKILTNTKLSEPNTLISGDSQDQDYFDETTLTARMARDIFSRYLLIAKNGQSVSPEDADKIANDVLSSPDYKNANTGVTYLDANLHIKGQSDRATLKKYGDRINEILKTRLENAKLSEGVIKIVNDSLNREDQNNILKLDSFIEANKLVIKDLLSMDVPSDLAGLHLKLVNSCSKTLADIEGMKMTFTDPVRSFIALNQWISDTQNFQDSLSNINSYYAQKIGI
jgi:hypothetical protein